MGTSTLKQTNNRIDQLFSKCREEKRAALVLFMTCGFPSLPVTRELLPLLEEAGCDLLELGVPFSDPIADGPVIQHSSNIALEAGTTFLHVLEEVKALRRVSQMPTILFGALNPYLVRGLENTARMSAEAGADGILAADLPYDEAEEFRGLLAAQNLHLITLIAPTTPDPRLALLSEKSTGFLYCISMKGTTGASKGLSAESAGEYIRHIKAKTALPLALGFGISKPEHVRQAVSTGADAVVVGSSLVRLVEEAVKAGGDWKTTVRDYVKSLAAELKRT